MLLPVRAMKWTHIHRAKRVLEMLDPFLFCIFFIAIFMIAGFSIGLAMFCGSVMYLALGGKDISIATETMLQGLYHKYTLLAIPLFILAAGVQADKNRTVSMTKRTTKVLVLISIRHIIPLSSPVSNPLSSSWVIIIFPARVFIV